MPSFAQALPRPLALDARLPTLVMAGACANALIVRLFEPQPDGSAALSFGIGPFQLITLCAAIKLSLSPGLPTRTLPVWFSVLVLAMILVPASAVSWFALALYAGAQAWGTKGEQRTSALLFAAMALTALWSSVLLKWLAAPVTAFEASLVGHVLSLVRSDIVQTGNLVGKSGHPQPDPDDTMHYRRRAPSRSAVCHGRRTVAWRRR